MVCPRCIMAVTSIFDNLGIETTSVSLGKAELIEPLTKEQEDSLKNKLSDVGFELLENAEKITIDQIKSILISNLQPSDKQSVNYSTLLSSALSRDYSSLSKLFSAVEGVTIEQYVIYLRIEKVKEYLSYGQKTLSEIAFDLGYSNVAHLSAQFKKITGMTPSQFKKNGNGLRKSLDII